MLETAFTRLLGLRHPIMQAPLEFRGEVEKTALYAGQSCGLVNDVRPAAAIVEEIARAAETIIRCLSDYVSA